MKRAFFSLCKNNLNYVLIISYSSSYSYKKKISNLPIPSLMCQMSKISLIDTFSPPQSFPVNSSQSLSISLILAKKEMLTGSQHYIKCPSSVHALNSNFNLKFEHSVLLKAVGSHET